jgi:hypothetical protein
VSHWYRAKDGSAAHFEGKDGKDTTLRDARRLLKAGDPIYPSVTTVLNVKDKPGLTQWLQEEAAMMAAHTAVHDMLVWGNDETNLDIRFSRIWAKAVIMKTREKTFAKADAGTDIHDILEQFMLGNDVAPEHMKMCNAVHMCLMENCGEQDWVMEERFASELGYGGMCDLHSQEWVVDYKTKDEVDDKTRGWPEQAEQLAAYANGLGVPHARLANLFVSRTPPAEGEPWGVKFFEHKDEYAWNRFKATLALWQISKKYGKAFDELGE